jgi:hypothetical protein
MVLVKILEPYKNNSTNKKVWDLKGTTSSLRRRG